MCDTYYEIRYYVKSVDCVVVVCSCCCVCHSCICCIPPRCESDCVVCDWVGPGCVSICVCLMSMANMLAHV